MKTLMLPRCFSSVVTVGGSFWVEEGGYFGVVVVRIVSLRFIAEGRRGGQEEWSWKSAAGAEAVVAPCGGGYMNDSAEGKEERLQNSITKDLGFQREKAVEC